MNTAGSTGIRRTANALAVILTLLVISPAAASEHATVKSAWGDLVRSSWSASGHSPDCWHQWEHTTDDGVTYDRDVAGGGWIDCGAFHVRCDADTLAYHGTWEQIDGYGYFLYGELDVELGCTLEVPGPARATIRRELPVPLDPAGHWVEITDPEGVATTYLGADPTDVVELDLVAGSYGVRLIVDIHYGYSEYPNRQPPYDGAVMVTWADVDVAAEASSWSAVKGLFR